MSDYSAYATKDITPTMVAFAEWLHKETGVEISSENDVRIVAIAGSLRGYFQASESWKTDPRNPVNTREATRAAKAAAQLEAAKKAIEKAEARVAKLEAAAKDAKAQLEGKVASAKANAKAKNGTKAA
jgi:hypothetical protein